MTAQLFFDQANLDATAKHLIATSKLQSISGQSVPSVVTLLQDEAHQVANSAPNINSVTAVTHVCFGAFFVIDEVKKNGLPGYDVNYFVRLK